MNEYDFEELPDEDFRPKAHHWALAAFAVVWIVLFFLCCIISVLELHQILFNYDLQ